VRAITNVVRIVITRRLRSSRPAVRRKYNSPGSKTLVSYTPPESSPFDDMLTKTPLFPENRFSDNYRRVRVEISGSPVNEHVFRSVDLNERRNYVLGTVIRNGFLASSAPSTKFHVKPFLCDENAADRVCIRTSNASYRSIVIYSCNDCRLLKSRGRFECQMPCRRRYHSADITWRRFSIRNLEMS